MAINRNKAKNRQENLGSFSRPRFPLLSLPGRKAGADPFGEPGNELQVIGANGRQELGQQPKSGQRLPNRSNCNDKMLRLALRQSLAKFLKRFPTRKGRRGEQRLLVTLYAPECFLANILPHFSRSGPECFSAPCPLYKGVV
jgi:hypothetical protein